ncbi:zinc finger CCCH domain-containing protein 43 isoform X1 [Arabidopsis lyrata subsp. lyrata]|uniref:zinc finger CCCH domain-containing protein 43 isoform X1 n=1 Tax=Arabidopsis lyrata subsp. lyrata TaxID=81972 RepID=UPI000A29C672|nr:zinc finger CCCH domain-containing protein 43 isoform X1 [Arabidopsis lyrata subsp. lyrata]|eukprot:XP_020880366.1 zinc finger CCCH domain-containing protein 43 isoform X1 [Arabidopsis lyrata subsp. lyrata]
MVNSEETADGFEPKPVSQSYSGDSSADRSLSDLNNAAEDLSDKLKNVGLDEVTKEKSETIVSVSESNGGLDSNVVVTSNQEEEEEEDGDDYGDGWSENESEMRETVYPVRPGAEDCSFYMRTGSCKFGSSCKFNHPLARKIQIARDNKVREKEEDGGKLGLIDCKYYFRTGGCKYGETCRFNHTLPKSCLASAPELNFLGLPIRPGEVECPYYMRNGSCKFGAECKFNHPDPTTIGGTDSLSFHGNNGVSIGTFSPKSAFQASSTSWTSPRHVNGTSPFIPVMLSQTHGVPSQTPEWNGYQVASVYSSERGLFSPSTTYLMNNLSAETSMLSQYRHQMPAEEFPERPDQPDCSYYMKTGDCKFKFNCKYHHPKNRLPKLPPYALNDKGLPLRPDQNICTYYSRYGICKFGPACRFDHSVQPPYSTESSQAIVEPPQVSANGNESDGWN